MSSYLSDGSYSPRIAVDDAYVYSVAGPTPDLYVYRIAKNGGGAVEQFAAFHVGDDDSDSFDFSVDDRYVYVMSQGDAVYARWGGYIDVYDKSKALVRTIRPTTGNDCSVALVTRIALYGGALFWAQGDQHLDATTCAPTGGIFADETPPRLLGSSPVGTRRGHNTMIADGSHLFLAAFDGIYRLSRAGGTAEPLSGITDGLSLATDGNTLFVATRYGAYAVTAPGAFHELYASASGSVADLAWDGAHLYVADGAAGVIRMNADGSGQTNLSAAVQTPYGPYRLAVDDVRVYYSVGGGESTIVGVCK